MGIGKPRYAPIDIDGLTDGPGADRQTAREAVTVEGQMTEMLKAEATLREAEESLKRATAAMNEAAAVLNAAKAAAGTIADGFKRTVAEAQAHSVIRSSIARKDLEQLREASQASLDSEKLLLEQHRATQLKNMKDHERKLSDILDQSNGVWLSHFWMKVVSIAFVVCSIIIFLYVLIKT